MEGHASTCTFNLKNDDDSCFAMLQASGSECKARAASWLLPACTSVVDDYLLSCNRLRDGLLHRLSFFDHG